MKIEFNKAFNIVINGVLGFFFLLIIFVPFIDLELGLKLDKSVSTEKRVLALKPDLRLDSIKSFPGLYEKYFNDNFSFRNRLVELNSIVNLHAYDESATPDVMVGKQGWLYYISPRFGDSKNDFRGRLRVSDKILEASLKFLEERTRELKKQNIQLLYVVAPDKHSVYPEFLPDNSDKTSRPLTRLDQITGYLKKNSSVQILDLRESLLKAKETESLPLYLKTDSHWNDMGSFIGYQEIMNALSIQPKTRDDFKWEQSSIPGGDLARMMGVAEELKEENHIDATPLFDCETTVRILKDQYDKTSVKRYVEIESNKNRNLPRILVFHDSYGSNLRQFIKCHFSESYFVSPDNYSSTAIDDIKPNIVVVEVVERFVGRLLPSPDFKNDH